MMRRLAVTLSLLFSACLTPAPKHHDPFAGMDLQSSAYPNLTAALMLSENTKSAVQYAERYEAARPPLGGPLGADKVMERIADVIKQNFKSVRRVGSLDAAKSIDADVVVMLDAYFDFQNPSGPGSAKIELNLKYLTPENAQIDGAQIRVRANTGFFAKPAQNIAAGTKEAAEKLDTSIKGSAKLAQLNKARTGLAARANPSDAALPPILAQIRSDIDETPRKAPVRPDDFALIIGIEKYQSVPSALYGERDAAAFRNYALGALGVPEENVIYLTGQRATRTGMAKYIEEWLPKNVEEKSRVYVYYSGHGAPDPVKGQAYLIPWDGDPSFLESTAYPVSKLYENLQKLKSKQILVALDSCFSGAGGRSVLAKGARPLVTVADTAVPLGAKLSVLTASSGEEIAGSLDDQGHGMFTYYLLKGLKGEAADAAGRVTLSSLHSYISLSVKRSARRQNREQTPQLKAADGSLRIY